MKKGIFGKDALIAGVIIVLLLSLGGCSNSTTGKIEINSYVTLEELPKIYTVEMAINNGDFVDVHGVISNEKVMDDFIKKVSQKEDAFIRTVKFTIEGDPIIIDFSYNGNTFIVITDTNRDAYGQQSISKSEYKNLITYKNESGKFYMLTNLDKITDEDFNNGFDAATLKFDPN